MSDIALRFLLANLAAALAIVVVLILRRPVRAAFGARIAYALWLLAPLAAIGSLLPPRVVEIILPAPTAPPVIDIGSAAPLPEAMPATEILPAATPILTPAPIAAPPIAIDPWSVAALLWLAGGIAMFVWQIRNQSRFMADARAGFAGPAVAGFLRPRIIMPSDFEDRFDSDERQIIIAHETIHLRRNDARINALVALMRCISWFNPLVHVAAHLMRIDQELACDAMVVERHPRAKAIYASALLKAQLAARPLPLGCYWPAGADHPLTERVEMLKRVAPGRARRIAGASALVLLSIGAGFSAWAAMPPETHLVKAPQDQPAPAPAPQEPVDLAAQPGFNADDRLEITGEVVRRVSDDLGSDFWLQAVEIRRNGGPAEPNAQLWRVDLAALRAGTERIIAGEELGYLPPKNPPPPGLGPRYVRVSAYGASNACNPECRAQAVQIMIAHRPVQRADRAQNAPQSQAASSSRATPSPFDNVHLVVLQGRITRIDLGKPDSYVWVETSSVARPAGATKQSRQTWRVRASAEPNAPNWARDPGTIGMAVEVRGYSGEETACDPNCSMNGTAIRQLSGYPMPGITFGSGFWLPPGPPLPEPPKAGLQPIRYEPQQAPATPQAQRPAPPTPPRTFAFSDTPPETTGGQPTPARLNAGVPIYLRGKIERLEFGPRTYVVFVRATSLSNYENGRGLIRPAEAGATLWALSPTNYFDNREAIEADLVGREIEAKGLNINDACKPDCRMKPTELRFARTSEVPAPLPDDSLISQFAVWYDTGSPNIVAGTIERLAFHDNNRTFDVYIRSDAANGVQSRLFQVRAEYRYPRADIERILAPGTRASVGGWRAREWAGTFCAPVCGMFGDSFTMGAAPGPFERVTPDGPALTTILPARPVVTPRPVTGLRIVALKRERLEISSRDVPQFVDRYFEPGEEYLMSVGNDWTISTPDGAAFEWRVGDTSLGPLAKAGLVKAQRIDPVAPSSELYDALAQRAEAFTRYGEKHPEWQKADERLRELIQRRKAPPAQ